MKTALIEYSLVLWSMLACVPGVLRAQFDAPATCNESVVAFTDRGLYISGEEILFSAIIYNKDKANTEEASQVLYLELITPDGSKINTGKYRITKGKATGCLLIPEDALSGHYYLKAYTRWMRNKGPGTYHYSLLKIVNPYREEVLAGQEYQGDSTSLFPGEYHETSDPGIRVTTDRDVYQPREKVRGTVEGTKEGMFFCVSGTPSVAMRDSIPNSRDSIPHITQYITETRGISVSGRITEANTDLPLANARVNLSVIGDKDMMVAMSDQNGQFYFALPDYPGARDIFLSGESQQGKVANVRIDNDFCTRPVNLHAPVFHLTAEEREIVLKMAANQKVSEHFRLESEIEEDTLLQQPAVPFYGSPDEILFLDKYIDLPTMEDYFHELVGTVSVRKHEGRKVFRFNSYKAEMNIYDPLVMIDWVVIDDMEKLLSVSPRGIEQIELVNAPWLKGMVTYGGIISFISKNRDFAGIDLPASGTFVNYQFLSDCRAREVAGPAPSHKPDARNTICWIPDLKTDGSGQASFEFFTPDTPGKYIIVINGISLQGDIIYVRKEIEVR